MLLLTGATGLLGRRPLARGASLARGEPVRCLVRDPRRLGAERVRVQLAIGDLADPARLRNALRGVDTVVHLAGAARDQPAGDDRGAQRPRHLAAAARRRASAAPRHFVWITPLGATPHHPMRLHRAKALAARGLAEAHDPDHDARATRSSTRPATAACAARAARAAAGRAAARAAGSPARSRSGPRTPPTAVLAALDRAAGRPRALRAGRARTS